MKKSYFLIFCLSFFCLFPADAQAQNGRNSQKNYQPISLAPSPALQALLDKAVNETIGSFQAKNLKAENVAATLIDLRDADNPKTANFRGEEKIYPASVVKMFYMVALQQWLADGKLKRTPELERGLRDMIVDSSNEATQYIVDVLTGVSNGAELSPKEAKIYADKREVVNRYFTKLGFRNINVNQKTYCEDLYGRERQFWNGGKNRNMLTTDATARLLAEIALGKAVSQERSKLMMDLMKRDFSGTSKDPDDQAHGFTAIALNNKNLKQARLWSKAGWTSKSRHDAAYIETPDGLKFVLVVFTENFANEREIIPTIAGKILDNLAAIK